MTKLLKKSHHVVVICILMLVSQKQSFSQLAYTESDIKLDTAVHMYMRFQNYASSFTTANLNNEVISRLKLQHDAVINKLDEVIAIGNTAQVDAAKYFKTITTYELGLTQGIYRADATALSTYTSIQSEMLNFKPSDFPKNYKFEHKTYSVNWNNISGIIHAYYAALAELLFNAQKYNEVITVCLRGIAFEDASNTDDNKYYYKYMVAINYVKAASELNLYNAESADIAIKLFEYFYNLRPEDKKQISDIARLNYNLGYNYIINLKNNNSAIVKDGGLYARSATALSKINDLEKASVLFDLALNAGYYEYGFIQSAYSTADLARKNNLGLLTASIQETHLLQNDCTGWRELANKWSKYGNIEKSNQALAKATTCDNIAAEAQREYEKKQEKEERQSERDFSVYAGIYPLPLIIRFNKYRDYGGVVGFGLHNFSMEFSYKLINLNHVFYGDLALQDIETGDYANYWSGYRAHIAFKFGERGSYSDGFFVGPLFEIVARNYEPVKSDVFDTNTNIFLNTATFNPTELSYNAYLNFGGQLEENHFMVSYFVGIGAGYHQFDSGSETFDNELYLYSNPILEYRKPIRYGAVVRMGMTIGLTSKK